MMNDEIEATIERVKAVIVRTQTLNLLLCDYAAFKKKNAKGDYTYDGSFSECHMTPAERKEYRELFERYIKRRIRSEIEATGLFPDGQPLPAKDITGGVAG